MRLGPPRGGGRDRDEDVDVFLVDAPAPASTQTVRLGTPRRRWPELALVLAGVAVVVAVGFMGGDDGDVEAAPTTTTRPRTTTTRRHHTTTTRRSPSTTRAPTTTTTWPQVTTGTGPVLPGEPTETVLGVLDGQGVVTILDLDSGNGCRTRLDPNGAWSPWGPVSMRGPLLVQTQDGAFAVGGLCAAVEVAADLQNGWLAAATRDTFWLASGGNRTTYTEYDVDTYERTGRELQLPRFVGGTAVAVERDLVVNVSGELTLVDPDTDERRDLGTGYPLAAFERTIALVTCPELRCQLGLLDVDTGERRVVPDVQPAMWYQSSFSPDGRLLLLSVPGEDTEQPAIAIIDVRTGEILVTEQNVQGAVFTDDSRWIIVNTGRLAALAVDGSGVVVHLDESLNNLQSIAVVR